MRIKVTPEDFVVKEVVDLALGARHGAYRVYLLRKAGWNTLDAIRSVASASNVDARLIGYAGLKDRHAMTSQHISVPAAYELASRRPDIRVAFLGFSDDFVSTKVLVGNRFDIRLGGLTQAECELIGMRAATLRDKGFPNFFDDQRFGSVTAEGDFVAERLVKGHLKGALKIHLAGVFPTQKGVERDRREKVAAAWGRWDKVLTLCETAEDKAVAFPLTRGASKRNLLAALNAIPKEDMSRYVAAYQGFIWNETLRKIIRQEAGWHDLREVPGKAGPYVFWSRRPAAGAPEVVRRGWDEAMGILNLLEIPTVSSRMLDCDTRVAIVIEEVLAERQVSRRGFNVRGLRSGYFKSFTRRATVVPEGFTISPPARDRDYPDLREIRASFTLPRGSYATMLLKALG